MSNKNQIKEVEDIEEVSDSELEIAEDDFPKKKQKKPFVMTDARKAALERGRLKRLENINNIRNEKEEMNRLKEEAKQNKINKRQNKINKLVEEPPSSEEEETVIYKRKPKKKKIVYVESDSDDEVVVVKGNRSKPSQPQPRFINFV